MPPAPSGGHAKNEMREMDTGRAPDATEGSGEVAGSPTLNLKVLPQGRASLVSLSGELDLSSAPPLRELLARMIDDDRPGRIVLDLSDLIYLDSTGLSVFVAAQKRATASGVEFCLANPNPSVGRLFEITALDQFFEIVDSASSAVSAAKDGDTSHEPEGLR